MFVYSFIGVTRILHGHDQRFLLAKKILLDPKMAHEEISKEILLCNCCQKTYAMLADLKSQKCDKCRAKCHTFLRSDKKHTWLLHPHRCFEQIITECDLYLLYRDSLRFQKGSSNQRHSQILLEWYCKLEGNGVILFSIVESSNFFKKRKLDSNVFVFH